MLSLIDQAKYNAYLKANDTASAEAVRTAAKETSSSNSFSSQVNAWSKTRYFTYLYNTTYGV